MNDCWVIMSKKVYNCTPFIQTHPGSAKVVLECSGDGEDHQFKFSNQGHSARAKREL